MRGYLAKFLCKLAGDARTKLGRKRRVSHRTRVKTRLSVGGLRAAVCEIGGGGAFRCASTGKNLGEWEGHRPRRQNFVTLMRTKQGNMTRKDHVRFFRYTLWRRTQLKASPSQDA